MTLPHEEALAIARVRQFMYELLDPKATPRVPGLVRKRARLIMKHYPILPSLECAYKMAQEWGGTVAVGDSATSPMPPCPPARKTSRQ
jgi:hypothetical protein